MDEAPRAYKRNMILLIVNYVFFGVGLACFSTSTVMPLFLQHLTDSAPLIGLVTAIFSLGWMIPQLIAARWIAHRTKRKPFLVYPSLGAPAVYALIAGLLFLADPSRLDWLLPMFIACVVVMALIDGLIGVPWLDFIGSAVPSRLRGRMMGWQEVLYAIATIGVGALVAHFLGEHAPPFPENFAWLALCAAGAFFVAFVAFLPLEEPEHRHVVASQPAWSEYLPLLGRILRSDRPFVTLIATRFLNGFSNLAFPFYVLYATTEMGISAKATGLFLSAQVAGSALGCMTLGYLYDRHGSRLVIRIVSLIGLGAPLVTLLLPHLGLKGPALEWLFALIFFANGINGTSIGAVLIGYTNFIIDYSTPADRPAYLGLAGTLAGPTALASLLGGWLLQVSDYQILFAVTAAMLFLAQFFAFRLPEPKRARPATCPDTSLPAPAIPFDHPR